MHLAAHGAAKLARVWQGCTWGRMERHFCTDEEDTIPDDDGEGISLEEMFKTRTYGSESCPIGDCPW